MAIEGVGDDAEMYQVDLNILDLDALQGTKPHQANATFDVDIHSYSSHPSQPSLADFVTEEVSKCTKLGRIIILLNSPCTQHIVTEPWLLNDFVTIYLEKNH